MIFKGLLLPWLTFPIQCGVFVIGYHHTITRSWLSVLSVIFHVFSSVMFNVDCMKTWILLQSSYMGLAVIDVVFSKSVRFSYS